jgi:hypothetical protein
MHGDWAAVSMSLICVGRDCETSNLITGAKGNPGSHHNGGNVGRDSARPGGELRVSDRQGGRIGAKKTPHTVSVALKVSKMVV